MAFYGKYFFFKKKQHQTLKYRSKNDKYCCCCCRQVLKNRLANKFLVVCTQTHNSHVLEIILNLKLKTLNECFYFELAILKSRFFSTLFWSFFNLWKEKCMSWDVFLVCSAYKSIISERRFNFFSSFKNFFFFLVRIVGTFCHWEFIVSQNFIKIAEKFFWCIEQCFG